MSLAPLEERLELFVITYNRASFLERTLQGLLESPFASCAITVLDNCSPDETPAVCARFQPFFRDLRVVRHLKNIGACPNYLRAVETSRSPYTWVVCDDDLFDWSDCGDVLNALQERDFDLICVSGDSAISGTPVRLDWPRGRATTGKKLHRRARRYFFPLTFIPCVIFKTQRFDSSCLAQGYRNSINLYPHFEFIRRSLQDDFSIYVSKTILVRRDHDDTVPSWLYWLVAWVNSCATIPDRAVRRRAIYEAGATRFQWFSNLASAVAIDKIKFPREVGRKVFALLGLLSGEQLGFLLLLLPLLLLPSSWLGSLRASVRRAKGRPEAESGDFDRFRL